MRCRDGFSLVETLVVVAAIGLLAALAALGMSRITYEADLAACAARLKGVAQATSLYAMDHKRRYPQPPGGRAYLPHLIGGTHPVFASSDLRHMFEGHLPFQMLTCPLSPRVSLAYEDTDPGLTGQSFVLGNYTFWMAWRYEAQGRPVEPGMFRIGDRWGWDGSRFRVLASDLDAVWNTPGADSSHPDDAGVMATLHYQNDEGATASMWHTNEADRGTIDRNLAYDDAAVARFRAVEADDKRMRHVPYENTASSFPGRWLNMPSD